MSGFFKNDPETSSIFSNNPLVSFWHSKNIRHMKPYIVPYHRIRRHVPNGICFLLIIAGLWNAEPVIL
jgi:hypothetical protein